MRQPVRPATTTAQLKADIDAGRTGDKVAFPDPGLAPLGTDDEAGGNPYTAEQTERARRTEAQARPAPPDADHGRRSLWLMIAVVAIVVAGVLAVLLVRR